MAQLATLEARNAQLEQTTAQLQLQVTQAQSEILRLSTDMASRRPVPGDDISITEAKSIMDVKAYNQIEDFTGEGGADHWIKWRKCFFSVIKQAYPNIDAE